MAQVKAVIFDIDGTLVDSVDLHARAWQETFAHFRIDAGYLQVRKEIGKGADKLLPIFLSDNQLKNQSDEIQRHREDVFHTKFQHLIKPFSGVRILFETLVERSIKIALASSAKGQDLIFYKRLLDVEDLLHAETSSDDVEESKPEPDVFKVALHSLRLSDPADALVVGDTPHDAKAALKANMNALGFRCGGVSDDELRRAGFRETYFGPAHLLADLKFSPIFTNISGA